MRWFDVPTERPSNSQPKTISQWTATTFAANFMKNYVWKAESGRLVYVPAELITRRAHYKHSTVHLEGDFQPFPRFPPSKDT